MTYAHYSRKRFASTLALLAAAAAATTLPAPAHAQTASNQATVTVDPADRRQTMVGFGGDFCKARFGSTETNDAVGRYVLDHLQVAHARIGIPLEQWAPSPGAARDEAQSHAALLLMQEMSRRKIPLVLSIWEAPNWMVSNPERQQQRVIAPEHYGDCIAAITRFLVTARDTYGVTVPYLSFNEADGGYDILFTPDQIASFMKQAGPVFAAHGLDTKWLVGDTSNGQPLVRYARPLLEDTSLAPYLGPIEFHSWDAFRTSDAAYAEIAALGHEFHKPVWCLEMGYDAQLWSKQPPVWDTWDNALKVGEDYVKTLRYSEAALLDYWEYQQDFQLSGGPNGDQPYPAFAVLQQMIAALPPGAQVVGSSTDDPDLRTIAAVRPRGKGFDLLIVNTGSAATVTVAGLHTKRSFAVTRSTASGQNQTDPALVPPGPGGRLTVDVPANSVVTLLSK